MTDYGNGNQPFKQRNNRSVNLGEQLFQDYCLTKSIKFHRLGFDEKAGMVEGWYKVAQTIRQMPDYLVSMNGRLAVVSVKGTWKVKTEDYDRLDWFEETYGTERCPFRYVIATPKQVTWLTTNQIKEAYEASTNHGVWPDGKEYRDLENNALGF